MGACGAAGPATRAEPPPAVAWAHQVGTASAEFGGEVAADRAGNVVFLGGGFVQKYNGAGSLLWSRQFNGGGFAAAADVAGNAFVAGIVGGWGDDASLGKYGPDGAPLWSRRFGGLGRDAAAAVAVDGAGNAFITGSVIAGEVGNPDAFVAKYDAAGTLLWSREIATAAPDYGYGVALDAAGNAFVSAYAGAALLLKYDPAGTVLWSRQARSSGGVTVDATGNAFIGGSVAGSSGLADASL